MWIPKLGHACACAHAGIREVSKFTCGSAMITSSAHTIFLQCTCKSAIIFAIVYAKGLEFIIHTPASSTFGVNVLVGCKCIDAFAHASVNACLYACVLACAAAKLPKLSGILNSKYALQASGT